MRSLAEIKERSDTAHLMIAKFGADGEKTVCYQSMEDIPLLFATIESQKEEIESLKWKTAHPVMCQGICTSQLDDYCGMHMSNESCIACNSIWTKAHVENAVFNQKAITELAVKSFEEIFIRSEYSLPLSQLAYIHDRTKSTLSEIERIQNEQI